MSTTTTFQVVTDAHCGSAAVGTGSGRKLTELAAPTLTNILERGATEFAPNFRIHLGDLIEHTSGHGRDQSAAVDTANFARALEVFAQHDIPTHHCIGNHPLMSATEEMLLQQMRRDSPYYSFDVGGHHIVMLHSRFTHRDTTPEHRSGSGIYIDEQQILREPISQPLSAVTIRYATRTSQETCGSSVFPSVLSPIIASAFRRYYRIPVK